VLSSEEFEEQKALLLARSRESQPRSPGRGRLVLGVGALALLGGLAAVGVLTLSSSAAPPPAPIEAPGGMKLVPIFAGTFHMGCTPGQTGCGADEEPAHSVTLTHDFWMSVTEVTQKQWQGLMGNNPSYFESCGMDCPVERVNWYDTLAFANALSVAEGLQECFTLADHSVQVNTRSGSVYDCEGYRLPTEAEWEYAARAGTDLLYSGSDDVDSVAWYDGNSGKTTHPVAKKGANDWDLYDMSGHVMEWVWDWYGSNFYSASPVTDPQGPNTGDNRVFRGGSWFIFASFSRVADRYYFDPVDRANVLLIGFRLARTVPAPRQLPWPLARPSSPSTASP
jgi:formylglycine-generating enzyme required for sulfatase activity